MMAHGGRRDGAGRKPGAKTKIGAEVREAAQVYTDRALKVLVAVMDDEKQPGTARVSAANSILDRGHGKARQPIEHDLDLSGLTDEQLAVLAIALGASPFEGEGSGGGVSPEEPD